MIGERAKMTFAAAQEKRLSWARAVLTDSSRGVPVKSDASLPKHRPYRRHATAIFQVETASLISF